ncbi:MAG: nucleotidyltransferase family protein [Bacilli bacterium]
MGVHKSIVAVYLAAGRSKRMGQNKLDLPIGSSGCRIGSLAMKALLQSRVDRVIAVVPAAPLPLWIDPFSDAVAAKRLTIVQCADSVRGQGRSLRSGVMAAEKSQRVQGALVCLADQPFVTVALLDQLLNAFDCTDSPFVAVRHEEVVSPPAVFSRALFDELMAISGDQGARQILRNRPGLCMEATADECFDVDTPHEYQVALEKWKDE